MERPVIRFEIAARNPEALEEFYKSLFGWDFDGGPTGYHMVRTGSTAGIQGRIAPLTNGQPNYLTVYVGVDDLAAALEKAESLGGHVVLPPSTMADGRRFAMISDPEEHMVGLLALGEQPAP